MRLNKVLPRLYSTILIFGCASLSSAPVFAADTTEWPRLQTTEAPEFPSLISDATDSDGDTDTGQKEAEDSKAPEAVVIPMTDEDWNQYFGKLPHYLDLGSFTLNQLNSMEIPQITANGLIIKNNLGQTYRIRSSWSGLKSHISSILDSCQGDWGVYIKDLKTGNVMEINEHAMESASLIKLFIAGTTLNLIEKGELKETDTIRTALHKMITVSDNESSNVLVRSFYDSDGSFQDGLDVVNAFIARCGFTNTWQVNGIADPSLWVSDGRINETSPADCGHLLEMIYDRKLVSHFASYRFENLLNNQEVNYKIPAALPEGTHISHKTGEVDDTENDAAIIYTPYGDYIFCIMSTDLTNTGSAVDTIHKVTRLVYDWFTEPIQLVDSKTLEPVRETEAAKK